MKNVFVVLGLSLIVAATVAVTSALASASAQTDKKVSAEKVKKETAEAVEAAQEFASEKKENFSKTMKANLTELDREIEALKNDVQSTSHEVQDKTKKKIAALQVKRDDLNKKYAAFEKSTGAAWTKMKSGLEKAWTEVRTAYDDAKTELKK